MSFTENAYAKITLTLDVTGKRNDGYHLLRMVMQSVSLCDRVSLEDTDSGDIRVRCDNDELSCGPDNTVFRAAQEFFAAAKLPIREGILFSISKRIPWQAGLGGGSADAAAALKLLNRRFQTGFSTEQLCEIGLRVGADVPFCVLGGTALAEGIGEKLRALPPLPDCFLVICKPEAGINTKEAYARLDSLNGTISDDTGPMLDALQKGDIRAVAAQVGNAFEKAVPLEAGNQIKSTMRSVGALGACMSGSGSAFYGVFQDEETAADCADTLSATYRQLYLCRPVPAKSDLNE